MAAVPGSLPKLVPPPVAFLQKKDSDGRVPSPSVVLVAESEVRDELAVALHVGPSEVIQEPPSPADHLQETAPTVMVLLVPIEVLPQVVYAGGQKGDLDGGASPVVFVELILLDDGFFFRAHVSRCLRRSLGCKGSAFRRLFRSCVSP